MAGTIKCFVDCASPYSYIAVLHLRRQRALLAKYNVGVEFCPIFLGGVNVATGNKPPSTLPARAAYGPYDLSRAVKHYNTVPLSGPPFFPMLSILPQRCMLAVKDTFPRDKYEDAYETLWVYVFNKHIDLAKPEGMIKALSEHFSEGEIREIMRLATTQKYKDLLTSETKKVVEEYGAFGAPWLWMTNATGESEPCFGSDRWAYVYRFMGIDFEDVKIVDKGSGNSKL